MGETAAGRAPLTRRGRAARLVAAGAVFALLTAGTVAGQDDDFPFGPFRMYATRDDPDGAVVQAVVVVRTANGDTRDVTEVPGTPRRSELEGRFSVYEADPAQFDALAPAYAYAYADTGDAVVAVTLLRREYRLRDGRRAATVDVPVATWSPGR